MDSNSKVRPRGGRNIPRQEAMETAKDEEK